MGAATMDPCDVLRDEGVLRLPVTSGLVSHFHAGSVVGSPGTFVSTWTAKSGSSLLTAELTAGDGDYLRPTLERGPNQRKYLAFNGNDVAGGSAAAHRRITGSQSAYNFINSTANFHLFMVVNQFRYGVAGGLFCASWNAADFGIIVLIGSTMTLNALMMAATTRANITGGVANTLIPGKWHIIEVFGNATRMAVSMDGATETQATYTGSAGGAAATNAYRIGRNTNDTYPFNGGIADVLLYNTEQSTADRTLIRNSLRTFYGLGGAAATPRVFVGLGDSKTAGSACKDAYPAKVARALGPGWIGANWGRSLGTAANAQTDWNANIEGTKYSATPGTKNVPVEIGINDVAAANPANQAAADVAADAILATITTLFDDVRLDPGFRLICCTISPAIGYLTDTYGAPLAALQQSMIDRINAGITTYATVTHAGSVGYYDRYTALEDETTADYLSDASPKGDLTASDVSGVDKLHPNALGHAIDAAALVTQVVG